MRRQRKKERKKERKSVTNRNQKIDYVREKNKKMKEKQ